MFENFQLVTIQSGTRFHARCPLCGDSAKDRQKKRFHLDYNGGNPVWHCFNCDKGSKSFMTLYCKVLGIDYKTAYKKLFKYDSKKYKERLKPVRVKPAKIINEPNNFNWILQDCKLDVGSLMYDTYKRLLEEFRAERMIPDKYDLFLAHRGKYKGRVIIPIYDAQRDIIFFQGRSLPALDLEPKYLNPVTEKSMIVLNESVFQKDKYIVVTEGIIDAFMVGGQGTACLGVKMSDEFLKRLLSSTDKGVILVFDNDDAGMEALTHFMYVNKYKERVRYFLMPEKYRDYKDINNIVVERNIKDIYDFVVKNSNDHLATNFILGGFVRDANN